MKKLFFLLALTAAVSCNAPQELTVMTLNMRYDNPEDGANNWRFRRERIAELIRSEAVDLLGTQEVLANQFDDLQALLPGYRAVGVGREDGARAGEFNAVFFRSDRFELLDSGVFWLSENPETPGSKGWDGACERRRVAFHQYPPRPYRRAGSPGGRCVAAAAHRNAACRSSGDSYGRFQC